MSASTMAEQGKKTREKVLKALGKRPLSAVQVAAKVKVKSRGSKVSKPLSAAMARIILKEMAASNRVAASKKGRESVYALPISLSTTAVPPGHTEVAS